VTAELWGRRLGLMLGAGWSVGMLVVFLGWWRMSGEATADDQFRWLGLAVAGMILCLGVSAGWVFNGIRAVGRRIAVAVPRPAEATGPVVELRGVDGGTDDILVAAAGMRYYHRRSCHLAQGKLVRAADRPTHVRDGRQACGVCRPDRPAEVPAA
jgi:hypothetical protein